MHTEKEGVPVYYVLPLLEMLEFSETDSNSLKSALDNKFRGIGGNIPLFVLATSDSINPHSKTPHLFFAKPPLKSVNCLSLPISDFSLFFV